MTVISECQAGAGAAAAQRREHRARLPQREVAAAAADDFRRSWLAPRRGDELVQHGIDLGSELARALRRHAFEQCG